MLEQFTWQQYTLSITGTALIYYAIIGLLYYRDGLSRLLPGRISSGKQQSLASYQPEPGTNPGQDDEETLLGKPATEEGTSISGMEDLMFAQDKERPLSPEEEPYLLLGSIPDLLNEFKTLISIVAETGESKEEFLSLFHFIISKYNPVSKSRYRQAINQYMLENSKDRFSFSLSEEELNVLWDTPLVNPDKEAY